MAPEIHSLGDNLTITVIRDPNDFRQLKETWNALAQRQPSYTPWLTFEWFDLCIKHFLESGRLHILLLQEGHAVLAIAPLKISTTRFKGIFQARKIEILGSLHSPMRTFLFEPSTNYTRIDLILKILSHVIKTYRNWDFIELERLPEELDIFKDFSDAVNTLALTYRTYFCAANWYLDGITYSSEQYFQNQDYGFRKQIANKQKRLNKKHNCDLSITSSTNNLTTFIKSYQSLRDMSWKDPEKDSIFNSDLTQLLALNSWLRVATLYADNTLIAAQKWIVNNKIAYIWDLIYHNDYRKYSPGSILSSELCKYVIDDDNAVQIDYLTGDEPYKKNWTPSRRERKGIQIFNRTFKGRICSFLLVNLLPLVDKYTFLSAAKNALLRYLPSLRQS